MLRVILIAALGLLATGCSHHKDPEPEYQYGWVNVDVSRHSVNVRVRPGTEKGNVDVHADWP